MTAPTPTLLSDDRVAAVDRLVAAGVAANRSEIVGLAIDRLVDAVWRAHLGAAIAGPSRVLPRSHDGDPFVAW